MDACDFVNQDTARAEALGWMVARAGGDYPVLLLPGGKGGDTHVRVHVHYAPSRRYRSSAGRFCFVKATVYWPATENDIFVTTPERLWHLVENHAPKEKRS